jgi:hypothetical protein
MQNEETTKCGNAASPKVCKQAAIVAQANCAIISSFGASPANLHIGYL